MKSFWQLLHKTADALHLPDVPNWVLGILVLVFVLRIPSFFEPYSYGDEMIYMTLGQGVRQGAVLYQDLHDNKPPLLYLTAALSGSLFWFKAALALFNIVSIVLFYKLTLKFFEKNKRAQKLSTFIFALLTTLPLLEGNIANAELFMVTPILLAFVLLLGPHLSARKVFYSGVLFGLATLFKVPAAFELPVIVFFWLITEDLKKDWKTILKNTFLIASGFVLPILLTFAWYAWQGVLSEYISAAFLQNVGYLSSFRPGDVQKSFVERNLPLLIRGFLVLAGMTSLYFSRKKLSKQFIFLSLWTLLALFAITLSERPYPHYLIQVVAPASLLLATFFAGKTFEQVLVIFPLVLIFSAPVIYRFWFYPTTSYYVRFINFMTGRLNRSQYLSSFSSQLPRNYEIADFLVNSTTTRDQVFIWDEDSPAIYALSRRLPPIKYTVPYHVNDFSSRAEVAAALEKNPPKFIILTSGNPFPELRKLIMMRYILVNQIGDADIWSRMDLNSK